MIWWRPEAEFLLEDRRTALEPAPIATCLQQQQFNELHTTVEYLSQRNFFKSISAYNSFLL